jgi:2-dehydro-3-deoxygalactonokinase
MTKPFIALDWGTTSFRAYHVDAFGKVMREQAAPMGILSVKDHAFSQALESQIGDWDKSLPVIACGMITSKQGWVERPYVDCPAGVEDLARSAHFLQSDAGRATHFITGLHLVSASLGHDVMRSEETQVLGQLDEGQHFITPGTHSKWIDVSGNKITNFATYITGETFAALREHSILGRLMTSDDPDDGMLHSLFSVRSLGLYNELSGAQLSSYLSGIVIGGEVAHALMSRPQDEGYLILASPKIGGRYAKALEVAGAKARYGDPLAIVHGLRKIAIAAGLI